MTYNPLYHHRRSIRLPQYDYSQSGFYFVTICTYKKQCLFGTIKEGKIYLNNIGKIVAQEWLKSSQIRKEIELDQWIIMPNHLHGIVIIIKDNDDEIKEKETNNHQNKIAQQKPKSLSSFIGGFKSSVTKRIKEICLESNPCVWQRNYYETIIRNEKHLWQIQQYIQANPFKWDEDPEKPPIQSQDQEILIDFVF